MGIKTVGKFITDDLSTINVGAEEAIPFSIIKVSNNYLYCDGEKVFIKVRGLYRVSVNVTAVAKSTDNIEINLQADGMNVPGARGVITPTATGNTIGIAFSTLLSVCNGTSGNYATLKLNNVKATKILVANMIVEKVA